MEPVQSRNPGLQPREFLHALRKVTRELEIPLIFDEIVTGFRAHPGGAQAWFGVQADMATYGKAVGGGMPMAVLAGTARCLDAFDGGAWQFGDASFPEAGVTFLGGTFIRHPMALAASLAMLTHLKQAGPQLQERLNAKTANFVGRLNEYFDRTATPIHIDHFASLFRFRCDDEEEYSGLLFPLLRDRGVHVYEDYPCYLSTAHTDEDIDFLVDAVTRSVAEMRDSGFLSGRNNRSDVQAPALLDQPGPDRGASGHTGTAGTVSIRASEATDVDASVVRFHLPPTESQMELWLASQMHSNASCAFNLCYSVDLTGPFSLTALRTAIQMLIERHDALRMTVTADGSALRFSPELRPDVLFKDFSESGEAQGAEELDHVLAVEPTVPFDLDAGPLSRAQVIKLAAQHHVLVLTVHHIICDGFSIRTLLQDLGSLYSAACQETAADLPTPMQYSDYARWHVEQQRTVEYAAAESYWMEQFSEPAPNLELPTDRPRSAAATYSCGELISTFDRALVSRLKSLARTTIARCGRSCWLGSPCCSIGCPARRKSSSGLQRPDR